MGPEILQLQSRISVRMPGPDEYIEHDEKQKEHRTYYEIFNNKINNKNNPRNKTLQQYCIRHRPTAGTERNPEHGHDQRRGWRQPTARAGGAPRGKCDASDDSAGCWILRSQGDHPERRKLSFQHGLVLCFVLLERDYLYQY